MKALDLVHLEVSRHAVERFLERGGSLFEGRAEVEILRLAGEARPVVIPPAWTHHPRYRDAELWRAGEWILLVRRVPRQRRRRTVPLVLTVFRARNQQRWW